MSDASGSLGDTFLQDGPLAVVTWREQTIRLQPVGARSSFGGPAPPPLRFRFNDRAHCDATGKRRFSSQQAAEEEIDRLRATEQADAVRAYPCRFCDRGWHLTKQERKS